MSEQPLAAVLYAQLAEPALGERTGRLFEQDLAVMRSISSRNDGQVLGVVETQVQMLFGNSFHAVASALELQGLFARSYCDAPEKLRYRFGAHFGPVVVEADHAEGEAVEIAVRVQRCARVGGIWVSKVMVDAVKGRLPMVAVPRGSRAFKDIDKTVELFELVQGLAPIHRVAKRWRLSKIAPAWANSMSARSNGSSQRVRGAI